MDTQKYIKIEKIEPFNNVITINFDFSDNISKYFLTNKFIAEYDIDLESVHKSILIIPLISTIMPIAWATGADVYIDEIDKSYLDSLYKVEQIFRGWFPRFSFSGKIYARNIVLNQFNNEGYALLFSGGVDSLVSYVRNKNKQSTLISIWGADIPTYEYEFWKKVKHKLLDFADQENTGIHFIKSNIQEIADNILLKNRYEVESWWGSTSHGLILTGLCAPLTMEKNIGTIYIASTHTYHFNKPWGSHPLIDNNISWSDIKIIHDGYELSRQDKIKVLKNHPICMLSLRVCWAQYSDYNCGHCEKCLRTITGLILENVDPQLYNFKIKDDVLNMIKIYFKKGMLKLGYDEIFMWEDIQKNIPEIITDSDVNRKYKAEKFFRWFKTFDVQNYKSGKFIIFKKYYYLIRYMGISTIGRNINKSLKKVLKENGRKEKLLFIIKNS